MTDTNNAQSNAGGADSSDDILSIAQTREYLPEILALITDGEVKPVYIGEGDEPTAVLIPFAQFMRLVKYDTDAAEADRALLRDRIADLDNGDYVDVTDEQLKNLGLGHD